MAISAMELIPGILPPSRENWELIVYYWQFFPLVRLPHSIHPFIPKKNLLLFSSLTPHPLNSSQQSNGS